MQMHEPPGSRHDRFAETDQPQALSLCAARGDRADREGRSVRADRHRSRQQAGLVPEDVAARQGAGARGDDRPGRGRAVREQRDLRIHRGDAGGRKAASGGCAATRRASRLDGVRLGDPRRSLGPRDHAPIAATFESKRQAFAQIRARRGRAWRGSVLRRRNVQPGRCGVRTDLPLFRCVRSIHRTSPSSRDMPKVRAWRSRACETAESCARPSARTIRNCCALSSRATTPIC